MSTINEIQLPDSAYIYSIRDNKHRTCYVVAEGQSGAWYYRKYSNGWAECYGTVRGTTTASRPTHTSLDFPFTMQEPVCFSTYSEGGIITARTCYTRCSTSGMESYGTSTVGAGKNYWFFFYACGLWTTTPPEDDTSYTINEIEITDSGHSYWIEDSSVSLEYITEEGKSGNWRYRKWNTGYAECWISYSGTKTGSGTVSIRPYLPFPFTGIMRQCVNYSENGHWDSHAQYVNALTGANPFVDVYATGPGGAG